MRHPRAWPTSSCSTKAGPAWPSRSSRGCGPTDCPAPGENLVERALAACGRRAAIRLTKRIPLGGGLGGGSADAAAVLRWAGCSRPRRGGPPRRRRAVLPGRGAGPGRRCGGEGDPAAVRGPGVPAPPAALRRGDGPGLPGLGRGSPAGGAERTHRGGAGRRAPAGRSGATRWGTGPGASPVLAGSGSTWFVEGAGGGREGGAGRSCASGPKRPGWCAPAPCRRAGTGTEGRAGAGRRKLLAGPALPPGGLQHLLVLLLAHPLATLFDQ